MPSFATYNPNSLVKAIVVGQTGAGKTGLLSTLLKTPLIDRLLVLDFDHGLNILKSYADEKELSKLFYQSFDKTKPDAAPNAVQLAMHWKTKEEDHGHYSSWNYKTVLVVDSLTFMGDAFICNAEEDMKRRKDPRAAHRQAIMGEAQGNMEKFVAHCFFRLPCNVIFNTHIRTVEEEGVFTGYPSTIGIALSQRIGRYVNDMWRIDHKPNKPPADRIIRTTSDRKMMLKNSAPTVLNAEEDFDLGKIFTKLQMV